MSSRHTVHVYPHMDGWVWMCGCGKRHWYKVEREARDAGLAHQQDWLEAEDEQG